MTSESTKLSGDIYYLVNAEKEEHTLVFPPNPGSSRYNLFIFTSGSPSFDKKPSKDLSLTTKDFIGSINDRLSIGSIEVIRSFLSDYLEGWKGKDIRKDIQTMLKSMEFFKFIQIEANNIPRIEWKSKYSREVYNALKGITGRERSVEPESPFKPFVTPKKGATSEVSNDEKRKTAATAVRLRSTNDSAKKTRGTSPSVKPSGSQQKKDKQPVAASTQGSAPQKTELPRRVRDRSSDSILDKINVAQPNPVPVSIAEPPKKRGRPRKSDTSTPKTKNTGSSQTLRPRKDSPPLRTERQIAVESERAAKKAKEEKRQSKPKTVGKGVYGGSGYIEDSE